jgi:hypothetical protein
MRLFTLECNKRTKGRIFMNPADQDSSPRRIDLLANEMVPEMNRSGDIE